MAEIPEGGFTSSEQLEAWLNSLPEEQAVPFARVIASRCALRVLPLIYAANTNFIDDSIKLMQLTCRANAIGRVASFYQLRPIEKNLAAARVAYSYSRSEALPSLSKLNTDFGVVAAFSAGRATAFSPRSLRATAQSAGTSAHISNIIFKSDFWNIINVEIAALQKDKPTKALANTPLWLNNIPYIARFDRNLIVATKPSLEIWLDWYGPIVNGNPPWGLPRDIADQIEERIAFGDNRGKGGAEFWERPVDVVNGEIKQWVDEARAAASFTSPSIDIEVEPQTKGALQFEANSNEPIGVRRPISDEDWSLDADSAERHEEARRLAQKVKNLCTDKHVGNNALGEFIDDFDLFARALGDRVQDLNPNLVIPRGEAIRQLLNAQKNSDDFSRLAAMPDDVLLATKNAMAAYNQYVALDDKLARRDEALLGPDARKKLISPDDGQAKIEAAVAQNVAKPEVLEATALEAKVAPDEPQDDDRNSRRYSESIKNFDRITIAKTFDYVKRHPKTSATIAGAAGYKVWDIGYQRAQWVWENQDWLLGTFANNPTMTNVLGYILNGLRHFPFAH